MENKIRVVVLTLEKPLYPNGPIYSRKTVEDWLKQISGAGVRKDWPVLDKFMSNPFAKVQESEYLGKATNPRLEGDDFVFDIEILRDIDANKSFLIQTYGSLDSTTEHVSNMGVMAIIANYVPYKAGDKIKLIPSAPLYNKYKHRKFTVEYDTPTVANDELVVYVNDYHGYFLLSEVEKAN